MRNIALLTTHSITAICAGQFVKFAHEADGADLAPSNHSISMQRPKRCPELRGDQRRLFPRGEVSAFVELVVVE